MIQRGIVHYLAELPEEEGILLTREVSSLIETVSPFDFARWIQYDNGNINKETILRQSRCRDHSEVSELYARRFLTGVYLENAQVPQQEEVCQNRAKFAYDHAGNMAYLAFQLEELVNQRPDWLIRNIILKNKGLRMREQQGDLPGVFFCAVQAASSCLNAGTLILERETRHELLGIYRLWNPARLQNDFTYFKEKADAVYQNGISNPRILRLYKQIQERE